MMEPEYRHNDSPAALTTHLFRASDIRDAGLSGGITDEPVTAVCGTVRSYGPFEDGVPEGTCKNCTAKADTTDDN